jgi:hypothetical protein
MVQALLGKDPEMAEADALVEEVNQVSKEEQEQ